MKLDEYLVHGDLHIPRGSLLRIKNGRDLSVHVWEGTLWLTQERDRRDIVLEAGQWFRLDRQGSCLLEATEPSAVALSSPHDHAFAKAIDVIPASNAHASQPSRPRRDSASPVARLLDIAATLWSFIPATKRCSAASAAS